MHDLASRVYALRLSHVSQNTFCADNKIGKYVMRTFIAVYMCDKHGMHFMQTPFATTTTTAIGIINDDDDVDAITATVCPPFTTLLTVRSMQCSLVKLQFIWHFFLLDNLNYCSGIYKWLSIIMGNAHIQCTRHVSFCFCEYIRIYLLLSVQVNPFKHMNILNE